MPVPTVTLNVSDNRLASAGYVHRWRPSQKEVWWQSRSSSLWLWPGTSTVTLMPSWDPTAAEAQLSNWTGAGTGDSYREVAGMWGGGTAILQENPAATNCTLTCNTTPAANQSFYVDLFLHAVTSTSWYAVFKFCQWYALRLLYNGTMQVWKDYSLGGGWDWQRVAELSVTEKVLGTHIAFAVYVTGSQGICISPFGATPTVVTEADPVITTAGGETYRTVAPAMAPVFYSSAGSFYFSYRYMRFAASGNVLFPAHALPWDYAGTFTLDDNVTYPRADIAAAGTVTTELRPSPTGTALTSPPAAPFRFFYPYSTLATSDTLGSPELNWAELRIDPTYETHATTPVVIPAGGYLRDGLTVGNELYGRRTAKIALTNIAGEYAALWPRLRMCATIEDGATMLWRGYLAKTTAPQEQSGDARIEFEGSDPLSRLDVPLSDAYIGDGKLHTEFVEELFKRAGLAPTDYAITADTTSSPLPSALGGEEALFQAKDGKFIREMVDYICKVWSGWELYCQADGTITYAPKDLTTAPVATLVPRQAALPTELTYYNLTPSRDETDFYNVIVVVGLAPGDRALMAYYYNALSVSDPTDADYLGMEKLLVVADSNLTTQTQVENALALIVAAHGKPTEEADGETDWSDTLDVGNLVGVYGSAYKWQIVGLDRTWAIDSRMRVRLRNTWEAV